MAYAGIQTMLLSYKMQKSDKEFELMQITNKRSQATKDSSALSENYEAKKAELKEQYAEDDPDYYNEAIDKLDDDYNLDLADIADWEDELQQKESNCNTQIKLLDGYITTWTSALQNGIKNAHTYGAQQ